MLNFMQKQRGSISVFLICILLPMVVFEGLLIDISKLMGARTVISGAGELAENAALASYDRVLYEVYGLFAASETEEELEENLEVYFKETLQDAGMDASDDDVKSLLAMALDTSDGSFEVKAVDNTSLGDNRIIKQQILEYIKLRGPANFGLSMLEKIKAISAVNKESEAVEKQLKFEKKLKAINDVCGTVYEDCKDILANAPDLVTMQSDYEGCINEIITNMYRIYTLQTQCEEIVGEIEKDNVNVYLLCVAYKSLYGESEALNNLISEKVTDADLQGLSFDANTIKTFSQYATEVDACLNEAEDNNAFNTMVGYLSDAEKRKIWKTFKVLNLAYEEYKQKSILGFYDDISDACPNITDETSGLKKYCEKDENSVDYDDLYSLEDLVNRLCEKYKKNVEINWKGIYTKINEMHTKSDEQITKAQTLLDDIEKLKKKIEEAQAAGQDWKTAITNLPDGSSKDSMNSKYESEAEALQIADIDALNTVASSTKSYYENVKTSIENVSFVGYKLKDTQYSETVYETLIEKASAGDGSISTTEYVKGNLTENINAYNVTTSITTNKFYEYLVKTCGQEESEESEEKKEKKEEAKESKKNIVSKGKDEDAMTANEKFENVETNDNMIANFSSLPSQLSQAGGGGLSSVENTADDSDGDNEDKYVDNATKTMDSAQAFLGGLEKLLTKGKEDLLIAMYGSEMFSCYTNITVTKNDENESDWFTLAGTNENYHLLSTKYNYLYGAEIEYLIWGDQNVKGNVNKTLLSIFGIRFLLNNVYAFTGDPEITATTYSWAVTLAGWTGFGVPIVQSVLTVALALAESVYDVKQLVDGEDVVIYKSPATWVMKPSNFTGEVVDEIADEAQKLANKTISSLMDKAEKVTLDTIDDFETSLNSSLDSSVDTLIDSSVAKIIQPIQAKTLQIVSSGQESANQIKTELVAVIDGMIPQNPTTTAEKVEKVVFEYVRDNYISAYVTKISESIDSADEAVAGYFQDKIDGIKTAVKSKLNTSELFADVKSKVSEAKTKLQEGAQEAAQSLINDGMTKLNDTMSSSKVTDSDAGNVSRGAMLTLNYKEYVDIFLMLASFSNEDKVLLRTADLIQLNMQKRTGENGKLNTDYKLTQTVTMIAVNAKVNVGTSFIGSLDSALGTTTGGKTSYPVTYHGVLGY